MRYAAESAWEATDRRYLREASLAHLTRKTTEARTQSTRGWIASQVKRSRRYRPPKRGGIRPDLRKEREELAERYYQLLSSHATAGAYLAGKIKEIKSSGGAAAGGDRPAATSSSRAGPGSPGREDVEERLPPGCSSRTI